MSRLLIITGPQGSGNHVFSKCLAVHEDVYGWKSLLNTYWEGHHHEPFADMWQDPELLREFDWTQSEHFVTSVSCPYFKDQKPHSPAYKEFINDVDNNLFEDKKYSVSMDDEVLNKLINFIDKK